MRRLSPTTRSPGTFIRRVVTGKLTDAICDTTVPLSDRTLRRIWQRFDLPPSRIRTALCSRCPPPTAPPDPGHRPVLAEVLAQLPAAVPHADGPLAAYQQATGTFVL